MTTTYFTYTPAADEAPPGIKVAHYFLSRSGTAVEHFERALNKYAQAGYKLHSFQCGQNESIVAVYVKEAPPLEPYVVKTEQLIKTVHED